MRTIQEIYNESVINLIICSVMICVGTSYLFLTHALDRFVVIMLLVMYVMIIIGWASVIIHRILMKQK